MLERELADATAMNAIAAADLVALRQELVEARAALNALWPGTDDYPEHSKAIAKAREVG